MHEAENWPNIITGENIKREEENPNRNFQFAPIFHWIFWLTRSFESTSFRSSANAVQNMTDKFNVMCTRHIAKERRAYWIEYIHRCIQAITCRVLFCELLLCKRMLLVLVACYIFASVWMISILRIFNIRTNTVSFESGKFVSECVRKIAIKMYRIREMCVLYRRIASCIYVNLFSRCRFSFFSFVLFSIWLHLCAQTACVLTWAFVDIKCNS